MFFYKCYVILGKMVVSCENVENERDTKSEEAFSSNDGQRDDSGINEKFIPVVLHSRGHEW